MIALRGIRRVAWPRQDQEGRENANPLLPPPERVPARDHHETVFEFDAGSVEGAAHDNPARRGLRPAQFRQ